MVSKIFSGVIVVLYGDTVNPIFHINMMIFGENLQKDPCYGL